MPLSIIFHGTGDTQYADDHAYLVANKLEPIGEGAHSLSFFADCIAIQTDQVVEPLFSQVPPASKDPYLLRISNELVIIQGADDTGTEVHNLIVSGLMAALNGIIRGEREINFFGFSRGSVQATHMTHELQRIKDYVMQPDNDLSPKALYSFICKHCYNPGQFSQWRTNRIDLLYKHAWQAVLNNPEDLQRLIDGLRSPDLALNGSLLDPVPGLCEGNPWLYVPWTNIAHHTMIAPMVNELHIAYMDSEFSVGFRAVWIEAAPGSDTQITRYHLPGCHSTANGNPVNHNPPGALSASPRFPFEKMRGVQKVFFYKLLQFAAKHHIALKTPAEVADRYLSAVFQHFIEHQQSNPAQNEFLRQQYKEIADNLYAYRKTRETCYLPPTLGLGGIEHNNHERILMTLAGERSMAELFSFDIKGAKSYPNFESFSLDFMTIFFPELNTPPSDSRSRPLNYSGIASIVQARYAPSSQEMGCTLLNAKIKTLLAASMSHQLDGELNKLLLGGLDRDGILDKLNDLVPAKLANLFYGSNLTPADREEIQESISAILNFKMPLLGAEEQTQTHRTLFEQKASYMLKFQKNMHEAIVAQTHTFLVDLLGATEQFQQRAANHIVNLSQSEQAQPFDANEYLIEAEQFYQALGTFQDKLRFSGSYLEPTDQPRLQYKIEEAITQFPGICERVLRKKNIDLTQEWMLDFTVMQPLKERLAQERAVRNKLHQNAQTIAALNSEKATVITECQKIKFRLNNLKKQCVEFQRVSTEGNLQSQTTISTLTARLLAIQSTLNTYQHKSFSGFTYMLLGCLSILVGMVITAIALHLVMLGTGSIVVPIMALSLGTGMTLFGMSALNTGASRQNEEVLSNTFFPENR